MGKRTVFHDPNNPRPVLTRRQALDRELVHYYTGQPCSRGHMALRYSVSGACMECLRPKMSRLRGDGAVDWAPTLRIDLLGNIPTPEFWMSLAVEAQRACNDFIRANDLIARTESLRFERSLIELKLDEPTHYTLKDDPTPRVNEDYIPEPKRTEMRARLIEIEGIIGPRV